MNRNLFVLLVILAVGNPRLDAQSENVVAAAPPDVPRFDLDFPGGGPRELIAAIEKSSGRPINVVIPEDGMSFRIPPLKMHNVSIPEIFAALNEATPVERIMRRDPSGAFTETTTVHYSFESGASANTDSFWILRAFGPPRVRLVSEKESLFINLAGHLARGYTVEDVDTAVGTASEMVGMEKPELKYHEDTQLLIVAGDQGQIEMVNAALQALTGKAPQRDAAE